MSTIVLGKSSDMWASCLSRPLIRGKTNKQNRKRHHKSQLVAQRMFETATTWSPQTACQRSVLQLIDILSNRLWQTNTRKTTTGKTLDWVGWLYVHVSWVCKARLACDCVTAAVVVVVCHGVHHCAWWWCTAVCWCAMVCTSFHSFQMGSATTSSLFGHLQSLEETSCFWFCSRH